MRANDEALVEVAWRAAAISLLLLVAALVLSWSALVPASLVVVGGLYGAELAVEDAPLDLGAPLVAAALVAVAELSYWSLEARGRIVGEPGETLRRLAYVATLALGTVIVAGVLLAVSDVLGSRGLALDLLGAAAAAGALVAVVALARAR